MKPDNNLVWAILATLFCCLPLGVVSIVHAARVDDLWASGDPVRAHQVAAESRKWAKWSAFAFAAMFVGYFMFWVLLLGAGASAGS